MIDDVALTYAFQLLTMIYPNNDKEANRTQLVFADPGAGAGVCVCLCVCVGWHGRS